jgi:hypothetical protein
VEVPHQVRHPEILEISTANQMGPLPQFPEQRIPPVWLLMLVWDQVIAVDSEFLRWEAHRIPSMMPFRYFLSFGLNLFVICPSATLVHRPSNSRANCITLHYEANFPRKIMRLSPPLNSQNSSRFLLVVQKCVSRSPVYPAALQMLMRHKEQLYRFYRIVCW